MPEVICLGMVAGLVDKRKGCRTNEDIASLRDVEHGLVQTNLYSPFRLIA